MADLMKYVKLKRSETCGFGFSILGGAGSELPPIIYDIIEGSPAANSHQLAPGDVIWEVNGQEVIACTTKEVLNCLRLSAAEVTLKLKTDSNVQARVKDYLSRSSNPELLRSAITQDDLQGVRHIKAKKPAALQTSPEQTNSSPPPVQSPTLSVGSGHSVSSHGSRRSHGSHDSNRTISENGLSPLSDRTSSENERNKKPKSEAYLMTGDLILNLSRTSHDPSWFPQQRPVDDLRKLGSCSVPNSPLNLTTDHHQSEHSGGTRHEVGSPTGSLCSPVSNDNNKSGCVQFTYPQSSTAVRISKSEDHLQDPNDNMCAVSIELDDDVTSSLNTLLDTRDDEPASPAGSEERADHRIVWSFNAPNSPDSVHSSHDSDSPLLYSPSSPQSPPSPSSSMQYSVSGGVYDKMVSGHDSAHSSNRSGILSTSSSLTSPDTDVPDELEWDDTTPTLHFPLYHTNGGVPTKDLLPNGHNNMGAIESSNRSFEKAKVKKKDENRIVIKVEGKRNYKKTRSEDKTNDINSSSSIVDDFVSCESVVPCDPDVTPTNTRPPTPGSGTISPDTLAYEELRESEDEITCLSEEDGVNNKANATNNSVSVRSSGSANTTSPPLSEDESDIDSLHSFHYSPKAVDMPSAVRLAKRLYGLEGFKKSDVSRHLSKNNEFSRAVAEEYLHYFEFSGDTLDEALRKFLDKFCLAGETQERERVLVHFSHRFLECNPGTFNSQDAVHTLTCAIMLLNTDLHGQSVGRKMTCNEFIDNLADLNDGENFPREVLKLLYHAISSQPLQWATDDDGESSEANNTGGSSGKSASSDGQAGGGSSPLVAAVGSNPFLAPPTGNGIQYKKGYIMRKCCTDPNGKKTAFGKRSWKMWFCVIQDLVLYLHKDEQGARKGPHPQLGINAIRLHHALATRAQDYAKKEHVFRLQTADQAEYLLQTSDSKELQAWMDTINFVAASLSAPPLPGACGSQKKFQRPLLPCSITKLNLVEQLEDHTVRLAAMEKEVEEHKAHPPDKNARTHTTATYKEKEVHYVEEIKRYRTYVLLLRSRLSSAGGNSSGGGMVSGSSSNSGSGTLEVGDLPVFEAGDNSVEGGQHQQQQQQRVVPPPIPERNIGRLPADSTTTMSPFNNHHHHQAEASHGAITHSLLMLWLLKPLFNSSSSNSSSMGKASAQSSSLHQSVLQFSEYLKFGIIDGKTLQEIAKSDGILHAKKKKKKKHDSPKKKGGIKKKEGKKKKKEKKSKKEEKRKREEKEK
ncbi:unnamed protein product, partial [Meganyctiphanes norvegica]